MNDRTRSLAVLALGVALVAHPPQPQPSAAPIPVAAAPVALHLLPAPTPQATLAPPHGALGNVFGFVQRLNDRLNDPHKPVHWGFGHGRLSVSIKTP